MDIEYEKSVEIAEQSIEDIIAENSSNFEFDIDSVEKSESTLDAWDYCFAIMFGLAGTFISTSEKFADYLDEIHKISNGGSKKDADFFQKLMGLLFEHKGDAIDQMEGKFINRNGESAYCIFHRLLWGHDIFSIDKDNPFSLMINQKGKISGIIQAIRHLLADTMSKQGLPMPGSSFLDYVDEDGKTSNYLIKITQNLSEEAFDKKDKAEEIYRHFGTIRAQDISAGAVVKLLSKAYLKARKITDKLRIAEFQLIGYGINFIGEAIVGCVRQNGVPYVNIPLAVAMGSAFCKFCIVDAYETHKLYENTKSIVIRDNDIVDTFLDLKSLMPIRKTAEESIDSLDRAIDNFNSMLDYLEGDDNE